MPNELERGTLEAMAIERQLRHHPNPVFVDVAAMAGVKGKAAEAIKDRLALIDFNSK